MAEQNNQAERAAFMLDYRKRYKIPDVIPDNTAWAGTLAQDEFRGWLAARAALPASVDAVDLPPPYGTVIDHNNAGGESTIDAWMELYDHVYTTEQVRQIIVADRRKQALTQHTPSEGTVKDIIDAATKMIGDFDRVKSDYPMEESDFDDIRAAIEAHNRAGKEQR